MYAPECTVPELPKLRGYLQVRRIAEDQLLFEAGADCVLLKGRSVAELLPALLACLDGSHSAALIKEKLSDVEPKVIDEALLLLTKHNLLEDSSRQPPSSLPSSLLERVEHQMNFWLSVRNDRYSLQDALWRSHVSVLGLGGVGASVAGFLASAGVGSLMLVDGEKTRLSDHVYASNSLDNLGELRTHWLGKKLTSGPAPPRIQTSEESLCDSERLQSLIQGSRLVVLCADTRSPSAARVVNEACLQSGISWISAHVDHNRAIIGPFVFPRQTACFTCYEYRCNGNSPYGNRSDPENLNGSGGESMGMLGPFAGLVASYLALEALKSLTGFVHPATTGRVHAFDFFTMDSEFHEVLKLPRCPSCGPARSRPLMKIWQLDAPNKEKTRVDTIPS